MSLILYYCDLEKRINKSFKKFQVLLKWIVKTNIKSYIEMFENKMWQNLVEINEISNDK